MAPTDNQRRVPRWLVAIVVALVAVRVAMLYVKSAAPSHVHWVAIADAPRVSAATKKPILYEFSAEWCGPCKRLEQDVANDKALTARINNAYVPVRVLDRRAEEGANPRDIGELQRAYQVRAFPTIVVVDASGVVRARDEGYSGRDDFAEFIEKHAARESH